MKCRSIYIFLLLNRLKLWSTMPALCTYEHLANKTGLGKSTLFSAVQELLHSGLVDQKKKLFKASHRPSFEYWVTPKGLDFWESWKGENKSFIADFDYIRRYKSLSRNHTVEGSLDTPPFSLLIPARMLYLFLKQREMSNGYVRSYTQSEVKRSIGLNVGAYRAALQGLIRRKLVEWYVPGFKSQYFFQTQGSIVKLSVQPSEVECKKQKIPTSSGFMELLQGFSSYAEFNVPVGFEPSSINSRDHDKSFNQIIASEFRRCPSIPFHIHYWFIDSLSRFYKPRGELTDDDKKLICKKIDVEIFTPAILDICQKNKQLRNDISAFRNQMIKRLELLLQSIQKKSHGSDYRFDSASIIKPHLDDIFLHLEAVPQ